MSFQAVQKEEPELDKPDVDQEGEPDWLEELEDRVDASREEIMEKVREKMEEYDGLVGERAAVILVGRESYDIDLPNAMSETEIPSLRVENVVCGMKSVDIEAKVLEVTEVNEFDSGKVRNIIVYDDTDRTQVPLWNKYTKEGDRLEEGDIVRIEGGYTKDDMSDYQADRYGVPAINIGDGGALKVRRDEDEYETLISRSDES